ncbi:hypothetical protein DL762_003457 [Monosporascus cannonballus]|uniref:Xylanolytic transcriptional activator regulatory domain-containing protein n=1 Tax=Monosporascus cannonballus TaxID=155416 RepID=A0ABY0HB19_9PEZI|nr:hypothetical protein DL762_003457 [Monosporascus cannonballus]
MSQSYDWRKIQLAMRSKGQLFGGPPLLPAAEAAGIDGNICNYPEKRAKRRLGTKTRITDIATRISQLEKTVASASRTPESPLTFTDGRETPRIVAAPPPYATNSRTQYGAPREALVENQYFNEALLARVLGETDLQSALATPRETPPLLQNFNPMGILSNPAHFTDDIVALHPSKQTAMRLWHIFGQNVDPAVKVLHAPTAEVTVYSVIADPSRASKDSLALVFSIYFASAATLEPDEAEKLLGRDKESGLKGFKQGLEQAFAEADFLNHTNTTLLQALAIYLQAVRSHNPGRGVWVLAGLAIRAAESIGLHRDGKKLKLTPFESEMRRRIWWHIIDREGRAMEDYGMSSSSNIPLNSVELPLNLDDSALYPEMTELPPPSKGWTAMTLPLVRSWYFRARQQLQTAVSSSPKLSARDEILQGFKAEMDFYHRCCNPVIPIQRLTMHITRIASAKIELLSRQQWQYIEGLDGPGSCASDQTLLDACQCLQMIFEIWQDEMISQYRWQIRSCVQYHMPLYILWHLCVRPRGPHAEMAWKTIDTYFELQESEALHLALSGSASKWPVLKLLRDKASSIRKVVHNTGTASQTPASRLSPEGGALVTQATEYPETNVDSTADSHWSQALDPLPDWSTFLEELSMEGIDFLNQC